MKKLYLKEIKRNTNKCTFVLKDNNNKYYFMNNNINNIIKFIQNKFNVKLSENIFLSEQFLKELFNKKGFIYL